MGHARAIPTMISIAAFVIFYIGSVVEYQELKNRFYILTLALKIKNNLVDVPLVTENKRKFLIRMNFVTKCLLYQAFNSFTVVGFFMLTLATFLSIYPNGYSYVGLFAAIFWSFFYHWFGLSTFSVFSLWAYFAGMHSPFRWALSKPWTWARYVTHIYLCPESSEEQKSLWAHQPRPLFWPRPHKKFQATSPELFAK